MRQSLKTTLGHMTPNLRSVRHGSMVGVIYTGTACTSAGFTQSLVRVYQVPIENGVKTSWNRYARSTVGILFESIARWRKGPTGTLTLRSCKTKHTSSPGRPREWAMLHQNRLSKQALK